MLMGSQVYAEARKKEAVCPSILVVTTAADTAACNAFADRLVAAWEARRPAGIEAYRFPASEKVPHDFIDPNQPNQQVEIVYPRLIEMLEKENFGQDLRAPGKAARAVDPRW